MNVFFDEKQLSRLLENFSAMTGIRACIWQGDGRIICSGGTSPLCERLGTCGDARCAERAARQDAHVYRCRAGACVAALPIRLDMQSGPAVWLCAGPFLDAGGAEEQWERAQPALEWFAGDRAALRRAFFRLRRLSQEEQAACIGMLEVLADSVRHRNLIWAAGETDLQRLEDFLDEHYMDKLSLAAISAQLHIGRTRLCALAKQLSGGQTLFYMITQRRIERAKAMLAQSDSPVSAVAEAVGISDYNYFSKVFARAYGMPPLSYRAQNRGPLPPAEDKWVRELEYLYQT